MNSSRKAGRGAGILTCYSVSAPHQRRDQSMTRRTVELAVLLVVAAGLLARESALRAGSAIYCVPTLATSAFLGLPVPTQNLAFNAKGGRVEATEAGPAAGYALERALRTPLTPATTEGDVVLKEFKF